jgi:plasmid stabilization system protein ParE
MKVAFSEAALRDLDEILGYLADNQPHLEVLVERRIRVVLDILSQWPESAQTVAQRPKVRVASLIHYPYRIFYSVTESAIEVIHIRHTSRQPWEGNS